MGEFPTPDEVQEWLQGDGLDEEDPFDLPEIPAMNGDEVGKIKLSLKPSADLLPCQLAALGKLIAIAITAGFEMVQDEIEGTGLQLAYEANVTCYVDRQGGAK
jgi:hypothetical protein